MISNSVTHLRSYTNTAIADIAGNSAPISPETLPKRWCCHAKRRCLRIKHRYCRIKWRVFHDILLVVHDVLLVVHNVLWCIKMFYSVSWCFTMFSNVLRCLASHATISIGDLQSPQELRQRRRDRRYCRESDPMLNSILNGDWSNSVPGRQILKGPRTPPTSY